LLKIDFLIIKRYGASVIGKSTVVEYMFWEYRNVVFRGYRDAPRRDLLWKVSILF